MLAAGEGRLGQLPGGLIALCMCLWWQAGGLGGGVRPGYKASFYGRVRSATDRTGYGTEFTTGCTRFLFWDTTGSGSNFTTGCTRHLFK